MYHVVTALRSYLGLSQTQLAKQAGITQPDLSEIETRPPYGYIDKYVRLSKALGVPVETLVKNDFTQIPETFFDRHPAPQYTPAPGEGDALLGRQGEEFILRRERERLATNHPALARLVMPYYKMKVPSPGYDILSFDDLGKPIFLEVKTSGHAGNGFRLTNHELEVAKTLTKQNERYILVCISCWGTEEQQVREIPFAELEQTYRIAPCYYFCRPIPKRTTEPVSGLTHFRKLKGLRQEEAGEALGINQAMMSLYETGSRRPPVETYIRASELLEASLDDLLASYADGERVVNHGE